MVSKNIANNKKAYHDYFIEKKYEAGIVLTGNEVKSVRNGNVSIKESHAIEKDGEIWITGMYIKEYKFCTFEKQTPRINRKLLLHRNEINKITGYLNKKVCSLIPTSLYLNNRNIVKLELGLAIGKKKQDKRQALKERDLARDTKREILK